LIVSPSFLDRRGRKSLEDNNFVYRIFALPRSIRLTVVEEALPGAGFGGIEMGKWIGDVQTQLDPISIGVNEDKVSIKWGSMTSYVSIEETGKLLGLLQSAAKQAEFYRQADESSSGGRLP
jgi:hypothetical protein